LKARLLIPLPSVLSVSIVVAMSWLYYVEKEKLLNRTIEETALVSEVIKTGIRNQMLRKFGDMTQETISLITRKPVERRRWWWRREYASERKNVFLISVGKRLRSPSAWGWHPVPETARPSGISSPLLTRPCTRQSSRVKTGSYPGRNDRPGGFLGA
jgi:hypothetical protein